MRTVGQILLGVLSIIFVFALVLGLRYANLSIEGFFRPREENVQREVFEQTKSYNEGMEQQLIKYKLEYDRGDDTDKDAVAFAVRHAYADYNIELLDVDLRDFVTRCRERN